MKIESLRLIPENIPKELQELSQWVLWDYKKRDGKLTKIPIQILNSTPAKINNPKHWGNFLCNPTPLSQLQQ